MLIMWKTETNIYVISTFKSFSKKKLNTEKNNCEKVI